MKKLIPWAIIASLVLGIAIGPVGASILGREPFVPLPHVEIAPPTILTIGGFAVTNTLLSAWLTTVVILLVFVGGSRKLSIVPGRVQGVLETLLEWLYKFIESVVGERYARTFFPLLATIFIFVAFNAWMGLLPIYPLLGFKAEGADHVTTHLLRAAGTDINMPAALAVISFAFAEVWGFKVQKIGYLREFLRGPNPIQMLVGVLEIISHLSRLLSLTFRLFGNMIAGEIVLFMMTFLLIFTVPLAFYALEILVGGVQALVFMALTLVYGLLAVAPHGGHDESHEAEAAHDWRGMVEQEELQGTHLTP